MRWALGAPGTGLWSCPSTVVNERAKTQIQTLQGYLEMSFTPHTTREPNARVRKPKVESN